MFEKMVEFYTLGQGIYEMDYVLETSCHMRKYIHDF